MAISNTQSTTFVEAECPVSINPGTPNADRCSDESANTTPRISLVVEHEEASGPIPDQAIDEVTTLVQKVQLEEGELASPFKFAEKPIMQNPEVTNDKIANGPNEIPELAVSNSDGSDEAIGRQEIPNTRGLNLKALGIRVDWLGTSSLNFRSSLDLQVNVSATILSDCKFCADRF